MQFEICEIRYLLDIELSDTDLDFLDIDIDFFPVNAIFSSLTP